MSRGVYLLIGAVCSVTALVLGAVLLLPARPIDWAWWGAACLLSSCILGELAAVEITRASNQAGYSVSIATIPHLAAAMLLPPWLADTLGFNVTAEGIETPAQRAQLTLPGGEYGQGYLLGYPVAAPSAEVYLLENRAQAPRLAA